jgi:hypothetical protein
VSHLPAGLHCPADGIVGAVWLAARLPSEEGGLSHAARLERGAREARANASARARTSKEGPKVEASEDRTLEVVLARR